MAMLAFFVFVSRYYVTCRNRQFEQSRWMIVVALLLFVVHYMCQMRLGWRQQGNDVGVLFNLLFYSPSAILLSWSQLNILRAGHRRWSFMRYGVVGYALMVLCKAKRKRYRSVYHKTDHRLLQNDITCLTDRGSSSTMRTNPGNKMTKRTLTKEQHFFLFS